MTRCEPRVDLSDYQDSWLNFASALWFFATPQPPKPSMLAVVEEDWLPSREDEQLRKLKSGFGLTTSIINGGIECGQGGETQKALNRINYYKEFAKHLGVEVRGELGCGRMKPFKNSGEVKIHWDSSWANDYRCQLVSYTTAWSALIQGDYTKCVRNYYEDLDI